MEAPTVQCLNCHRKVLGTECKLFFGVMVCGDCHTVATVVYDRSRTELRAIMLVLQESIRIALVEGRLRFPDGAGAASSKHEVLKVIMQLVEAKNERSTHALHGAARD